MEEAVFVFIVDFLKQFNYPLIHSMNYDDIANILHVSNRNFLVCWTLKLLDEVYFDILDEGENNNVILGNLVCQHGFCSEKEKLGFLTGELPVETQISIISRMFRFIARWRTLIPDEKPDKITLDDLYNLENLNLNLFPSYGEIKTFSAEERRDKIKEFQYELQLIKVQQDTIDESSRQHEFNTINLHDSLQDLGQCLRHIDKNLQSLIKKPTNGSDCEVNYEIDPNSGELFRNCCDHIKLISQYVRDVKTICDFSGDQNQLKEIDDCVQMIQGITTQICRLNMSTDISNINYY
ncbi:uncharacterized protein LOC132701609 [Cylas formicarius]|uniref:uncharacterized protein LOC132701609 n=1 Tax=Cylas formicarius TaxID=197179 RepID=UPI0029589358|nr:uncharacterized protein LOC132701609 [Cylas formicarius]